VRLGVIKAGHVVLSSQQLLRQILMSAAVNHCGDSADTAVDVSADISVTADTMQVCFESVI